MITLYPTKTKKWKYTIQSVLGNDYRESLGCRVSSFGKLDAETEAKHLQKQLKKTASFSVKGKKQLQRKSDVVLLNETLVVGT